jgi:co-chaperonin GroES (HSP10)
MSLNLDVIDGKLIPIRNRIIVKNMYFGEQKTKAGLILRNDDGTSRGIYPRWAQVHAKGPENQDPYVVGDWILIEHGRWTRGVKINEGAGEVELRMIEAESVMLWSQNKPKDIYIGQE